MHKIAIIGPGNMGKAIAEGLILSGNFDKKDIVFGKDDSTNIAAVKAAKTVIIAVKPDIVPEVLRNIKNHLTSDHLILSVAAKVRLNEIKKLLIPAKKMQIVRVMPNICASVGQSMSCWVKSSHVSDKNAKLTKLILSSIGKEIEIKDEKLMGFVTILAGSGPAFYFYLAELFEKFATKNGLKRKDAEKIIRQTFAGSAILLNKSDKSAQVLRKNVTSKKGTTEAVIKVLKEQKFDKIFLKGLKAGHKKASN